MQWKSWAVLVSAAVAVNMAGCGDTTAPASFQNQENKFTLYALTGSPQSAPSGVAIRGALPAAIDASLAFDAAFDITDDGDVTIYSIRKIASELLPVQRVGFQTTTLPFDQMLRAPKSGYVFDSLIVVPVGQTVVVDLVDASCANVLTGFDIHSKMVVDSLDLDRRAIYLHILSNPNCGLVSLTTGLPRD